MPIIGGKASMSENTQISWTYLDVINLSRVTRYHDGSYWITDMHRIADNAVMVYKELIPLSLENVYFAIKSL
jgi:hypothetical protein